MSNRPIVTDHSLLRAVERVIAQRAAGSVNPIAEPIMLLTEKTTSQVRARLNFIPDGEYLHAMIAGALTALRRGVRWARGSILNLLV